MNPQTDNICATRSAALSFSINWGKENRGQFYIIEPVNPAERDDDKPWRLVHGEELAARKPYFESAPVTIGTHEWRMVVKDSHCYGRVTEYQFRTPGQMWRQDKEWPTYNSHDGTYAGCPKSLANKVFYPNEVAIKAALKGETIPESQMTLY